MSDNYSVRNTIRCAMDPAGRVMKGTPTLRSIFLAWLPLIAWVLEIVGWVTTWLSAPVRHHTIYLEGWNRILFAALIGVMVLTAWTCLWLYLQGENDQFKQTIADRDYVHVLVLLAYIGGGAVAVVAVPQSVRGLTVALVVVLLVVLLPVTDYLWHPKRVTRRQKRKALKQAVERIEAERVKRVAELEATTFRPMEDFIAEAQEHHEKMR